MRDIGLCLWCTLQTFSPSWSIVFWCCLKVYKHRLVWGRGVWFELVLSACSGQAGKHSFRALALTLLRHLVETSAKLLWRNNLNQATHDFLSQKHHQRWAYNSHTKHARRQCTTGESKNSRFRQETQVMEQLHSGEWACFGTFSYFEVTESYQEHCSHPNNVLFVITRWYFPGPYMSGIKPRHCKYYVVLI